MPVSERGARYVQYGSKRLAFPCLWPFLLRQISVFNHYQPSHFIYCLTNCLARDLSFLGSPSLTNFYIGIQSRSSCVYAYIFNLTSKCLLFFSRRVSRQPLIQSKQYSADYNELGITFLKKTYIKVLLS